MSNPLCRIGFLERGLLLLHLAGIRLAVFKAETNVFPTFQGFRSHPAACLYAIVKVLWHFLPPYRTLLLPQNILVSPNDDTSSARTHTRSCCRSHTLRYPCDKQPGINRCYVSMGTYLLSRQSPSYPQTSNCYDMATVLARYLSVLRQLVYDMPTVRAIDSMVSLHQFFFAIFSMSAGDIPGLAITMGDSASCCFCMKN